MSSYARQLKDKLKCLDVKTGEVKWEAGGVRGQSITADGKLLVMWGGTLVIAEASPVGYKELAKVGVAPWGTSVAPVLAGDRIYCRGSHGDAACL